MFILLQLTPPLGTGVGPNFNLTADVGVVVPSTATATQLLAGIIVQVLNTATTINITPLDGECPTPITVTLPAAPTTTTTSTTTTITPECTCTILKNNSSKSVGITYLDCNGTYAGFSMDPYSVVQMCGTHFLADMEGVLITPGGPCISSPTGFECNECAAGFCPTYLLVNTSLSAETYYYIDCNGNNASVTIPGVDLHLEQPYGVNICTCGLLPEVKGGEIIPKGLVEGPVPIGHSAITVTLVDAEECLVCKCYRIYNPTDNDLNFTITDCYGKGTDTILLKSLHVWQACGLEGSLILDDGLVSYTTGKDCYPIGGGGKIDPLPIGDSCEYGTNSCITITITGYAVIQ